MEGLGHPRLSEVAAQSRDERAEKHQTYKMESLQSVHAQASSQVKLK